MVWKLPSLGVLPAFPDYSGPLPVGTVDVEIPTEALPSPSPKPRNDPPTVSFRIFYPCEEPASAGRPVRWIPQPQRATVSAFAKFLGAGSRMSELFAYFPHLIYYVNIPANRNAPLLAPPTSNQRWPVMFFSHGLAGSRNLYSHICGSIASHGVVVIAMDHRDGSSPIQFVRATTNYEAKIVDPIKIPHQPSKEVYEGRDKQLRIRTWELAMAHTAVLDIDQGHKLENLDFNNSYNRKERIEVLDMFAHKLDVHEPGRIIWGGHSFGANTTVQFVKSVFYAREKPDSVADPLFTPDAGSPIVKQITPSSPIALLDLWCLPFNSPEQSWLWDRPLPCYATGGLGGRAIVSVLSEGFVKWNGNLMDTKRAIGPPAGYSGQEPNFFYPSNSQHFSQSDFGILFPWVTQRFMKAEEPERVLKLNMRAVLQMLRECDIEVSPTSAADKEVHAAKDLKHDMQQDADILSKHSSVRGWNSITLDESVSIANVSVADEKSAAPTDRLSNGQETMEL